MTPHLNVITDHSSCGLIRSVISASVGYSVLAQRSRSPAGAMPIDLACRRQCAPTPKGVLEEVFEVRGRFVAEEDIHESSNNAARITQIADGVVQQHEYQPVKGKLAGRQSRVHLKLIRAPTRIQIHEIGVVELNNTVRMQLVENC